MKKQELIKQKITASAGYEYIQGKRKQIKKTETVLVPISIANSPKKFDAFIEKEKERIRKELEIERLTQKSDLTFREYAKSVAERKRSQGDVRGITAESNQSILDYLNTFVGDYKMKDIDKNIVDMVKTVINNKTSKNGGPISNKTKYNYFSYFRSVINAAMADNYYLVNPIANVRNFGFENSETTYLEPEELIDVMKKLSECHIKVQVEILLQLFTGARRGEVLSLRWIDIKERKGQSYFDLQEGFYYTREEGYIRGELKTKKSKRKLPIHPLLLEKLQQYKTWQDRQKEIYGEDWQGNEGYIICKDNGAVYNPDHFSRKIEKKLKEMGFDGITSHSLRRSFATLADASKETTSQIANLLGHSDIIVTNNSYIRKTKQLNCVDFLNTIIESSEAKERGSRREIRRLKRKIYS